MSRHTPKTYPDQEHIEVVFHKRVRELTQQQTGDRTTVTYA